MSQQQQQLQQEQQQLQQEQQQPHFALDGSHSVPTTPIRSHAAVPSSPSMYATQQQQQQQQQQHVYPDGFFAPSGDSSLQPQYGSHYSVPMSPNVHAHSSHDDGSQQFYASEQTNGHQQQPGPWHQRRHHSVGDPHSSSMTPPTSSFAPQPMQQNQYPQQQQGFNATATAPTPAT